MRKRRKTIKPRNGESATSGRRDGRSIDCEQSSFGYATVWREILSANFGQVFVTVIIILYKASRERLKGWGKEKRRNIQYYISRLERFLHAPFSDNLFVYQSVVYFCIDLLYVSRRGKCTCTCDLLYIYYRDYRNRTLVNVVSR